MSAFEFYFSFFGLILGIAVANVAIGFGRLWRAKERVRIGICLPLLGALLLCHAVMNWNTSWLTLQQVPVEPLSLLIGLFVALPYVFVSTIMFPEEAVEHGSLDDFYLSHSRMVMIVLMVPTTSGRIGSILYGDTYTFAQVLELFLTFFLVPLVLLFWRNIWAHRIGLGLLVALLLRAIFS